MLHINRILYNLGINYEDVNINKMHLGDMIGMGMEFDKRGFSTRVGIFIVLSITERPSVSGRASIYDILFLAPYHTTITRSAYYYDSFTMLSA